MLQTIVRIILAQNNLVHNCYAGFCFSFLQQALCLQRRKTAANGLQNGRLRLPENATKRRILKLSRRDTFCLHNC
jgi:hypothetical protein